jgi:UDP-N-acetylglucosamine 1-carboxyvinyltransferase
MDALIIRGGNRLSGRVEIGGAKNAALPLMAATLLTPGVHTLHNMPLLSDTRTMARVLETLGARVAFHGHTCVVDTTDLDSFEAPYDLVRTMRASVYVLGPLLARLGDARVSLPGGCAWGPRPINLHLEGLNAMNANLEIEHGYIVGRDVRLKGADFHFGVVSVGATAQLMMAAVRAEGVTTLDNVAIEPDVTALAEVLVQCGAEIEGIGSRRLTIRGVKHLWPIETSVIPDRIEAGTFLAAGAITGGNLVVENCEPAHLGATLRVLERAGCEVEPGERAVTVRGPTRPRPLTVVTEPFPGFPTDMQAQVMALCTVAGGTSTITDSIYFDRFSHVPELMRLGADVHMQSNVAIVKGVDRLSGAPVMATDIRASAGLVLAALVADGETRISRVYHLDRGYEHIEQKLVTVGADVLRVSQRGV